MEPTLRKGDILIISNRDSEIPEKGDIIIFQDKNTGVLVVHRVNQFLFQDQTCFLVTKGDALENPDRGYIKPEAVKGTMIFRIPRIAYLVYIIKSRLVFTF